MSDARPAWARESAVLRLGSGFDTVEVTPEWAFGGSTGAGVRVAVVDSGIDADHPMLGDCVDTEGGVDVSIADDGSIVVEQGAHGDVFGHGTACAGIIHTLAPEARITSVRVLGPSLTGKAAAFHAGLMWAVEQGFDVINLSLGTSKRDWALAFHDVCDRAYFGSSFVVTAANNVARPSYPSLFASVASVACNTSTDPLRFHANPEPPTEFLARGIDVEVPWTNGGTTTTTGNSFAAPHIAGFAALVKSKHPQLRPFQIKSVLWATAANVREATAPEPAGRRGTMYAGGSRGTAMALVRPTTAATEPTTSAAEPATSSESVEPTRRRRGPVGTQSAVGDAGSGDSCTEDVGNAAPIVVEGFALGDVVDRWRWGSVRFGHRVDGDVPVALREIAASSTAAVLEVVAEVAALDHPHLAPTIAVVDDPPLIVTGRSVDHDPTARPAALAGALAVTSGLAAAHRAGMMHGDLGPSWIELSATGRVRVGGVGVASVLHGSSSGALTALSLGALTHLAPEQFQDGPPTPVVDVHALGLVWFELLTGELPWPRATQVGALIRQRLSSPPRPLVELAPDVPAALASVIDRAVAPDPTARFADANEFARAAVQALVTTPWWHALEADPRVDLTTLPAADEEDGTDGSDGKAGSEGDASGAPRRRWRRRA